MPNAAPSGQDAIRTTGEDDPVRFTLADFGFSDADGNGFAGVVVTTLPPNGRLLLNNTLVTAGQFISASLIAQGRLAFVPDTHASGSPFSSFTFQVRDNGGTADGGVDTDATPNTFTINVTAQPDAPIVQLFAGTTGNSRAQFTEDQGPVLLDRTSDATVTDVDSADFDGGRLFLGITSSPITGVEDISILAGNGITVSGLDVGGTVSFNGVNFGVITIHQNRQLEITFNDQATPARVQQLIRQLTYNLTGNDAPAGERQALLSLKDGDGGDTLLTDVRIDLTGVDDAPVLSDVDAMVVFSASAVATTPQIIDADVTLFEPDSNFSGATLQLGGAVGGDVLAIRNQGTGSGQISISGNAIYYHRGDGFTDLIGTFSGGGAGTGPLTIALQTNASTSRVEQLIENLTFFNSTGEAAASRTLTFTLADRFGNISTRSIEVLIGAASGGSDGDDVMFGTSGNDVISSGGGQDIVHGDGGDDVIDGGTGADALYGDQGNDVLRVDSPADQVFEAVGEGSDRVVSSSDYVLTDGAEIEVLETSNPAGTAALSLTGNAFGQTIRGNAGANVLRGGGGDDALYGNAGDDVLVGESGFDTLFGGAGNDVYFVDAQDDVFESAGEGQDRVASSEDYVLNAGSAVERLEAITLSSTARLDLAGNEFGQEIAGNNGVNVLRGEGGNDTLYGYGGDDFLIGGSGADRLVGSVGDDTYFIEDSLDTIEERAGEGRDRVATTVSFTLAAGVSIEVLEVTTSTTTNAVDLTGNEFDNTIAGNFGNNVLSGGAGNDVLAGYDGADTLNGGQGNDVLIGGGGADAMAGGEGSDRYYVDNAGDTLVEAVATGYDVVGVSVSYTLAAGVDIEQLEPVTFNSTDALNLTGNEFGSLIIGNNGANQIDGGGGADILEGLGGSDTFVFSSALGGSNIDRISDYTVGVDQFLLRTTVFTGLAAGPLAANAFVLGTQAADADDRIIYDAATGAVWFDADGSGAGAAVQFATVNAGLALSAWDFIVG